MATPDNVIIINGQAYMSDGMGGLYPTAAADLVPTDTPSPEAPQPTPAPQSTQAPALPPPIEVGPGRIGTGQGAWQFGQNQPPVNVGSAGHPQAPMPPGALTNEPTTTGTTTAPQKEGLFSFLDKPGASDSLIAFGSAMLRGRNFNEGLANAADAVNKVSQQYRPLSEPEIARAKQLAALQQMMRGSQYSKGEVGYAPGMGYVPTRYNQTTGVTEYQLPDGKFTTTAPAGFKQRTDSGYSTNSKLDANAFDSDFKNYESGKNNERQFAEMVRLAPTINAGGDAWSQIQRRIGATLGVDFGGKLDDQQYFEKLSNSAQLEGAQSQKGLGQFTEMERKIVANSLPSIGTKESTIVQVGTRLALQQELKNSIIEKWDAMSEDEKRAAGSYREFKQKQIQQFYDNYEQNYQRKLQELSSQGALPSSSSSSSSASSGGNRPPLDEILK